MWWVYALGMCVVGVCLGMCVVGVCIRHVCGGCMLRHVCGVVYSLVAVVIKITFLCFLALVFSHQINHE